MDDDHCDFEKLIEPIEDKMIRSVGRIVRDPNDADEAFQEALVTVWERLDQIRQHPNPQALILRICVNSSYDILRRKARHRRGDKRQVFHSNLPDSSPSAAEQLVAQEERAEIFLAIGLLSRKQAEAVLMRFVQDLSYSEIALALGCREVTARKHIARARVRLSKLLSHLSSNSSLEIPR